MGKDLCQIRVMFPVENDEKAIEIKNKIKELLEDNKEAQVHFALMPQPPK